MIKPLPKDKQPSNDLKAKAHIIADQKGLTEPEYRKLAQSTTGVSSMLAMSPHQAEKFIRVLDSSHDKKTRERVARYAMGTTTGK